MFIMDGIGGGVTQAVQSQVGNQKSEYTNVPLETPGTSTAAPSGDAAKPAEGEKKSGGIMDMMKSNPILTGALGGGALGALAPLLVGVINGEKPDMKTVLLGLLAGGTVGGIGGASFGGDKK